MISVLHIGLPLVPPWLSAEDCDNIAARLTGIRQKMEAAGYRYEVVHASPDRGLSEFRERLRRELIDAVVNGGGVAGDPELASFKQQILQAVSDEAPQGKVLEYDLGWRCKSWLGAHLAFLRGSHDQRSTVNVLSGHRVID